MSLTTPKLCIAEGVSIVGRGGHFLRAKGLGHQWGGVLGLHPKSGQMRFTSCLSIASFRNPPVLALPNLLCLLQTRRLQMCITISSSGLVSGYLPCPWCWVTMILPCPVPTQSVIHPWDHLVPCAVPNLICSVRRRQGGGRRVPGQSGK